LSFFNGKTLLSAQNGAGCAFDLHPRYEAPWGRGDFEHHLRSDARI
jgi:hypothetical protein